MEEKRPIHETKETYLWDKRDLFMGQKRPIYETKETYLWDKRDLLCRARRASCMAMTHAKIFVHMLLSSCTCAWKL